MGELPTMTAGGPIEETLTVKPALGIPNTKESFIVGETDEQEEREKTTKGSRAARRNRQRERKRTETPGELYLY